MEITGTAAGAFDQLAVGGLFTATGTLYLDVDYGAAYGDSFLIFTNGLPTVGSFNIATNLGGGLHWDTSALASLGIVSVVPEPSVFALTGSCLSRPSFAAAGENWTPRQVAPASPAFDEESGAVCKK